MTKSSSSSFPYFVGVRSLHDIVNKHTRVCVMNILGSESSKVTPVSHASSGGNVVAGVQYGASAGTVLETPTGDIPVFGSVKEVIAAGHHFDTGVIYLPPSAVSSAVSELCVQNEELEKVVIVTEKISVRDSRYIRWGCQNRKIDVIGGNSLGVANPWDAVRVGGAIGGDKPWESLRQGSVAIYSNSGNFCTTLAQYLKTAGFGNSTVLSSGKDLYIQFALPEFLYCAENDPRTKLVVVYIEPGGYYEKQALDWIKEGRFQFTKPLVVVVTGRWKRHLRRSVGHAGAIGGGGDDAIAKEKWFDEYFGVGVFNPEKPIVSKLGVRVATIQDVPVAVSEVMKARGEGPDFKPEGDLSLKPWFVNDQGLVLPSYLSLPAVKAISPYDAEIEEANKEVGAHYIRESMRNRSGASRMSEKTQVSELHNESLLTLVAKPFGDTVIFSVTKNLPELNQLKIIAPVLNWFAHYGTSYIQVAQQARKNGASPNGYIGSAVMTSGNNEMFQALKANISTLIDLFYVDIGNKLEIKTELIKKKIALKPEFAKSQLDKTPIGPEHEKLADYFADLLKRHGLENIFTRFCQSYNEEAKASADRPNPWYLMLSGIILGLAWKQLSEKQISRQDAEDLPVYLAVNGIIVGTCCVSPEKNKFFQQLNKLENLDVLKSDYTATIFKLLFNRQPTENENFALNALLNLTITNGPGTLSAMGAKESVSAKNFISTAFAGFMTNTGFAHGGNGFEAVQFLIEEFAGFDPYNTRSEESEVTPNSKLDEQLDILASRVADDYLKYKKLQKQKGNLEYKKIPCTNHPVFKGKPVNIDPREDFVRDLFKKHGLTNPLLEFYHHLVVKLHAVGVTPNVFCVNIDAVLAATSLDLIWKDYQQKKISLAEIKDIVFTIFLLGRMVGSNAEIADHRNRGTDMDCRTPAKEITFVQ